MVEIIKEFRDFLMKGNLITLAVAFVVAQAFYALVNAFINYLFMPILSMIVGKTNFGALFFTINKSVFGYGAFINAAIVFIATAAAVFFFIVKPAEMISARFKKPDAEEAPSDEERRHQELLTAVRGIAR